MILFLLSMFALAAPNPRECGFEASTTPDGAVFIEATRPGLKRVACHVLIPPSGGFETGRVYPLLVLLHGLGDRPISWFRRGRILERIQHHVDTGAIPPIAVLAPSGAWGYWTNWADGKHDYKDLLMEDILNRVERDYPISTQPSQRIIAGVSMGGFGALSIGLRHPEHFGAMVAFSATDLDIAINGPKPRPVYFKMTGSDKRRLKLINPFSLVQNDRGWGQKILLVYGSAEPAKFKRGGERLAALLNQKGMDVSVRIVPRGVHGWNSAWNQQSIDWALSKLGLWLR